MQFAALGARIQAHAKKTGLGREIPDDWLLQEFASLSFAYSTLPSDDLRSQLAA
jgi:hypothetical protein